MMIRWGLALRASAETAKRLLAGAMESHTKCVHGSLNVDQFSPWNLCSSKLLWTCSLLHQYPQRGVQSIAEAVTNVEADLERAGVSPRVEREEPSVSAEHPLREEGSAQDGKNGREKRKGNEKSGVAEGGGGGGGDDEGGKGKPARRDQKVEINIPKVQVLGPKEHPLDNDEISPAAWKTLRMLRKDGYHAYLVGGGVRDLYLGRTPKDYDVLCNAYINKVKKIFGSRAIMVGRRYPICHIRYREEIIEVSSIGTAVRTKHKSLNPDGWKHIKWEDDVMQMKDTLGQENGWAEIEKMRWENAMKRDFTINGLMYDPFSRNLYDYVGGLRDIKKGQIRTIAPPVLSFSYDPARMLRALRISARLKFPLESETAQALQDLIEPNEQLIGPSRRQQELSIMMEHGTAEASLRILWRYDCLKLLLPIQDEYFHSIKFNRRARKSNLLLDLFATLDKTASPDKPCRSAMWGSILALHMAMDQLKPSKESVAALAFACDTMDWDSSVEHALVVHKRITGSPAQSKEETGNEAEALLNAAIDALNELCKLRKRLPSPLTRRQEEEAMTLLRRAMPPATDKGRARKADRSPRSESEDTMDELAFGLSRVLLNTIYPKDESSRKSREERGLPEDESGEEWAVPKHGTEEDGEALPTEDKSGREGGRTPGKDKRGEDGEARKNASKGDEGRVFMVKGGGVKGEWPKGKIGSPKGADNGSQTNKESVARAKQGSGKRKATWVGEEHQSEPG